MVIGFDSLANDPISLDFIHAGARYSAIDLTIRSKVHFWTIQPLLANMDVARKSKGGLAFFSSSSSIASCAHSSNHLSILSSSMLLDLLSTPPIFTNI